MCERRVARRKGACEEECEPNPKPRPSKGDARGCEAHEVKQRVTLVRAPFYLHIYTTSFVKIQTLRTRALPCQGPLEVERQELLKRYRPLEDQLL